MTKSTLPIGRRVAQWRVRRGMTQQVFADRLGKSASWVDKVERGVRTLDRLSVIRKVAVVLRVDLQVLIGRDATPPDGAAGAVVGVDRIRAALARYDTTLTKPGTRSAPPAPDLARRVEHTWLTYQHARYPQLVRTLPDLILDAQRAHRHARCTDTGTGDTTSLLVQVYRITASVLVKLGEADLAWFVADRAMTAAATDPLLAATAALHLGEALRTLGAGRLAMTVTITAAQRIAPAVPDDAPPDHLSVYGALLLQAALAAATCSDGSRARELTDQAREIAEHVGDGHDHHRTAFGPIAVECTRISAALELGDGGEAITRHRRVIRRSTWPLLPAEHRGAHLLDAARAYLLAGDLDAAARTLADADRTAPAETRIRPVARTLIEELICYEPAGVGITRLAEAIGLTRP